eukprot:scaffold70029_cov43-Prasinocladus_malaysianus.AAC.2
MAARMFTSVAYAMQLAGHSRQADAACRTSQSADEGRAASAAGPFLPLSQETERSQTTDTYQAWQAQHRQLPGGDRTDCNLRHGRDHHGAQNDNPREDTGIV